MEFSFSISLAVAVFGFIWKFRGQSGGIREILRALFRGLCIRGYNGFLRLWFVSAFIHAT